MEQWVSSGLYIIEQGCTISGRVVSDIHKLKLKAHNIKQLSNILAPNILVMRFILARENQS